MIVFIQIPCLNEEDTLPLVLKNIPKTIPGIDQVEVLIIDDGSTDKTIAVAKKLGVKHFVKHTRNRGLARSFHDGINYALAHGADIVVNTDGDNQYPQERIGDLVQPIIRGEADMVIGDRQTHKIAHFSRFKKIMQRFGTYVVNQAAGSNLPDAASGFRAYSRESLYRLNIITKFSYTMETIVQAGNNHLRIASIAIETNPKTRESRLFKNSWHHMTKSAEAIIRSYFMYKPFAFFGGLGTLLFIAGSIPFINYAINALIIHHAGGHLQSLILGVTLVTASLLSFALGVIADLQRINRVLHEDTLERLKHLQFDKNQTTTKSKKP
jgi:glycosyltransferase involved in cell wall biosynthesis